MSLVAEAYSYDDALGYTSVNGALLGTAVVTTCKTQNNARGDANNVAFQEDCNQLVGGASEDPWSSAQALADIAADQINAQNSAALRTANMGVAVVTHRLERVRLASGLPAYGNGHRLAAQNLFGQTGGGASGDAILGPFGLFLNGQYVDGSEEASRYQPGYDLDGWNLSGGLDYRLSEAAVVGAYLQYWNGQADFDHSLGDMDTDSWGGALYGTYFLPSGLYFDGLIGYSSNDYDLSRKIAYTLDGESVNQMATSDPSADLWNFSLGLGYTVYRQDLSFTPSARFTYLHNAVDGYQERMSAPGEPGGSLAQAIDSQTYQSFRSELGFQISKAFSTGQGVLVPQLSFSWVHEFLNDQEAVGTRFVDDINNTRFYILTNDPDPDYFDLGVGMSAQFSQGRSGFLAFNSLLGYQGVTYNSVSFGMRFEF